MPVVLAAAIALIEKEEGCYPHAYPDPLSPLGKAIGHRGIVRCGTTGVVPNAHAHLSGAPWTIGYGTTGPEIVQGLVWTQDQCRMSLVERAQHAMNETRRVWPGVDLLHTNAQAALTSLVYNRGASMKDIDSRREMRSLGPAIKARNYGQIAQLIRSMKRLWPNVRGLLARRELEAVMVERQ